MMGQEEIRNLIMKVNNHHEIEEECRNLRENAVFESPRKWGFHITDGSEEIAEPTAEQLIQSFYNFCEVA